MKTGRSAERRLRMLERLRTLELEAAQTEHAASEDAARRERTAVAEVEGAIEAGLNAARVILTQSSELSVDALRSIGSYGGWQRSTLAERRTLLHRAEDLAKNKQAALVKHFESLSVAEKLSERQRAARMTEELRDAQKLLDEQAMWVKGRQRPE